MSDARRLSATNFNDRVAAVEECRRLGLSPTVWVCPRCNGRTRYWVPEGQHPTQLHCLRHDEVVWLEPLSGM